MRAKKTKLSSFKSRGVKVQANSLEMEQDGPVFKQRFFIHLYEVGPDRKVNIESLLNFLQETTFNQSTGGHMSDDFSTSPEMSRRNLIWVVTKMRFIVECYPSWGDTVQVDTWYVSCGRNRIHVDWHVHEGQMKKTFLRATGVWSVMNKETRRLSKIPEDFKTSLPVLDCAPIVEEDKRKIQKLSEETSDYVKGDLIPKWSDLDLNQHVNNVKYISWIFESVPMWIHESYELTAMTLEYRRECRRDSILKSLSAISIGTTINMPETLIECEHMLQLECGIEVMRGRTQWRLKSVKLSEYT